MSFTPPQNPILVSESSIVSETPFVNQIQGDMSVDIGSQKINNKVLSLNGISDYLISLDPLISKTVFTIDFWVFLKDVSGTIISQTQTSSLSNTSLSLITNRLQLINGSSTTIGIADIAPLQWYHIAIVRDGLFLTVFLNGVSDIAISSFQTPPSNWSLIGSKDGTNFCNMYLDAFRVRSVKAWTSTFIPPLKSEYIGDDFYNDVVLFIQSKKSSNTVDPYSDYVAFQYRFDSWNQSNVPGITDDLGHWGITYGGNAAISQSHFKNQLPCILFNGKSDTIVIDNNGQNYFGSSFTIEMWVYIKDFLLKRTLVDKRISSTEGILFYIDTDSKAYFKFGDSTPGWDVEITSGVMTVGWHHIAISRNGSSWMGFIDGTQIGTTITNSVVVSNVSSNMIVGRNKDGGEYWEGGISELQINKLPKYNASFTAPTTKVDPNIAYDVDITSLLLHFDDVDGSTNFVDSSRYNHILRGNGIAKVSTTQSKFGGSSLYLSGTVSSGIIVEPSELLLLGEDDFTIECWVRPNASASSLTCIMAQWSQTTSMMGPWWILGLSSSSYPVFYFYPYSPGTASLLTGATQIVGNTWYHLAVTRNKDTFILWVNGSVSSFAYMPRKFSLGMKSNTQRHKWIPVSIGDYFDTSFRYGTNVTDYAGYIDEVRIVRGRAMFTAPFTIPTSAYQSPLYPIKDANCVLFLDASSQYEVEDQSGACNVITKEGSLIAGVPVGGSCGYFDGAGDFIRLTSIAGDVACGISDFCLDFWINPINGGHNGQAYGRIIETEQFGSFGGFCCVVENLSNPSQILFHDSGTGSLEFMCLTGVTIPNNSWTHIAFTREKSVYSCWINGILQNQSKSECIFDNTLKPSSITFSNFNRTMTATSSGFSSAFTRDGFDSQSSIGVYWECLIESSSSVVGVYRSNSVYPVTYPGSTLDGWGYGAPAGQKYNSSFSTYGDMFTTNDVVSVAVKNGKIWFAKNGVWQASGNPETEANPAYSNLTGFIKACCSIGTASQSISLRTNLSEFSFKPPKGFISLREAHISNIVKNRVSIGCNNAGNDGYYGYIDNMRFTKHIRYSLSFTEFSLVTDNNASSVTLLLNMNTDPIVDESNSSKSVTNTGTVTTTEKKLGVSSVYLNGTSSITLADSVDWFYGTNAFTIETFFKLDDYPHSSDFSLYSQRVDDNNYIRLSLTKAGVNFSVVSSSSVLINLSGSFVHDRMWNHIAVCRSSDTFKIYINGVSIASQTTAINIPDFAAALDIGKHGTGLYMIGWLDSLRITKGVSRYPAQFPSFVPPQSLQPLKKKITSKQECNTYLYDVRTAPSSKFSDSFSMVATSPDFVNPFQGSHDIQSLSNQSLTLERYDFTFEGWFLPQIAGSRFIYTRTTGSNTGIAFYISTNALTFRVNNSDLSASVSINAWSHIVFQRRGNLRQIFLNGIKVAEGTLDFNQTNWDHTTSLGACSTTTDPNKFYGLFEDVRLTRGIARYNSNFTPPNQLTEKYLREDTWFFDDIQKLPKNLMVMGNPKILKLNSISNKGAYGFDGDDDYIILSQAANLQKEDFTLECWVEPHSTGTVSSPIFIWSQGITFSGAERIGLALVSNEVYFFNGAASTSLTQFTVYTKFHIAMTRLSGMLRIFIDGVKKYESNIPQFLSGTPALGLVVDDIVSASQNRFRGYLKNFRLLKNDCLYVNDFTPSTDLSPYNEASQKVLLDPNNPLRLGDFQGTLDDVGIYRDSIALGGVKRMYSVANQQSLTQVQALIRADDSLMQMAETYGYKIGPGRIWGYVTTSEGLPLSKKLILLEFGFFTPIRETVSLKTNGFYEFKGLLMNEFYTVIAIDDEDYRYNDIIRSKVKPEV